MKIYGITIVSSNGNWLVEKNGVKTCVESLTKLFTNKSDRLDYAVAQMKSIFEGCCFEDCTDENGQTEDDFRLALEKGEDICIQDSSEHYTFEFFEQEVEESGDAKKSTMIDFDSTIYCDVLDLLFDDKADAESLKKMVLQRMQQSDYEIDQIRSDTDMPEDKLDELSETTATKLMDFVTVDVKGVEVDFSETEACNNRSVIAFNVPCKFDVDGWIKSLAKED